MGQGHHRLWRHLAVFLAWPLAPFWLLFAAINYPLIVGPDFDSGLVAARENAAAAGVGLALLSVLTMLWAAGVFGRRMANPVVAVVLLVGWVLAGLPLYVNASKVVLASVGLPAHAVGVAVVLLSAAGNRSPAPNRNTV